MAGRLFARDPGPDPLYGWKPTVDPLGGAVLSDEQLTQVCREAAGVLSAPIPHALHLGATAIPDLPNATEVRVALSAKGEHRGTVDSLLGREATGVHPLCQLQHADGPTEDDVDLDVDRWAGLTSTGRLVAVTTARTSAAERRSVRMEPMTPEWEATQGQGLIATQLRIGHSTAPHVVADLPRTRQLGLTSPQPEMRLRQWAAAAASLDAGRRASTLANQIERQAWPSALIAAYADGAHDPVTPTSVPHAPAWAHPSAALAAPPPIPAFVPPVSRPPARR